MPILWLDGETYSECDLRTAGTHRYAEHPSTEITVVQWAVDDGEPVVEDLTGRKPPSAELRTMLEDPRFTIVAHNSHFDRTILRHVWGIDIPPERWMDTMVKAMCHGLPGSLDKIGRVLGLEADKAKDARGKALIQLFCKPRPKNMKLRRATRETHPQEWAEFLEYSRQDIVAMREIDRRLPSWNYKPGSPELALWHLDQRVNDRGFACDVEFATAAIEAVKVEQARLKQEIQEETYGCVTSASKRDQLLAFILAEYGIALPSLKADVLRGLLDDPDLPEGVKLLINIRLEATKTSTAKYVALVRAVSKDGRLRNVLQFAGAQRTSRWAGRIFQPQNMPRPTPDFDELSQEIGVAAVKAGAADLIVGDVMQLTANAVRGCIVAKENHKLCVADLSNIEGRMLAWLAGESWKLQAFRDFDNGTGADLYILAYARAFGVNPADVIKYQRQIGKVMELGLGYEGGVAAFLTFAAVYDMDLDELAKAVWQTAPREALQDAIGVWGWAVKNKRTNGLGREIYIACEVLKKAWRNAHPATTALWADVAQATRSAISRPGETFRVRDLAFRRDGAWLRIRLPSGRYLCYLEPEVDDKGQISYMGVNQFTRQWCRIKTYGGKLVENITQAAARDVLAANMPLIEDCGYEIVLSVHDELLTETPDHDGFTSDALAAMMSHVPAWAKGLPLAAAGFECHRYRKD